jgi:TolB-like protein/Tfp pilus assembly protein PilF
MEGNVLKGSGTPSAPDIRLQLIRAELDRILASKGFIHSRRAASFLRFIVEYAIEGRGDELKEYVVGLEVFNRKPSYDPRTDPIVRVEALRLREKLAKYYETDGRGDPVRIELAKRSYVPAFRLLSEDSTASENHTPEAVTAQLIAPDNAQPSRLPARRQLSIPAAFAAAIIASVLVTLWMSSASRQNASALGNTIHPADPAFILVLPFADLSAERDQEYFSAGLTEELITALSRVAGLRVVPRTSAFQFKDKGHDVRKISREWSVGTVLEGSVRKSGERVRISVQMSDAARGYTFWAETYERSVKDALAIQQEISEAVISSLRSRIQIPTVTSPLQLGTHSPEAFNSYLRGRYHWSKRSEESLQKAIGYFERALADDPQFAAAYSGLADSYALLAHRELWASSVVMPKAKTAALKALEIDDTLAEAHSSLGYVNFFFEWNWPAAERHFQRALELNPQYPPALQWYAFYLMSFGRKDEALAQAKLAEKLDPLSANVIRSVADMHYRRREYDQAIEKCREALDLDANFSAAFIFLGRSYEQKRLFPEAIESFERAAEIAGGEHVRAMIAHTYGVWGRKADARKELERLLTRIRSQHIDPFYVALVYTGLGEIEQALDWLEKAVRERSVWIASLPIDPRFDTLRREPRFLAILERLDSQFSILSGKLPR